MITLHWKWSFSVVHKIEYELLFGKKNMNWDLIRIDQSELQPQTYPNPKLAMT